MEPATSRGNLRWRCMRRGLLELDLVFQRFLAQRFNMLGADQLAALDRLAQYEDVELWSLVSGREQCSEPRLQEIIDLMRAS